MSRSANLPPIRVTPETKASLQAVLHENESLTQFIESAVLGEAAFRAEQRAAIDRAQQALEAADSGHGLVPVEDFLEGMRLRARAAQDRIRAAVAAKGHRPDA